MVFLAFVRYASITSAIRHAARARGGVCYIANPLTSVGVECVRARKEREKGKRGKMS